MKVSKASLQNILETEIVKGNKEMPKEKYMSLEKRQQIISDLRLM